MITRFASKTDFDVAGRKVTTNTSTRYESGTENDLALNARVEVEGSLDAAGLLLVAAKIEFRKGGGAGIAGKVVTVVGTMSGTSVIAGKVEFADED